MEQLQTETFRSVLADVEETLAHIGGAALACNQVGLDMRAFVTQDGTWFINPMMLYNDRQLIEADEGCLSFPGLTIRKVRDDVVKIGWTMLDGEHHDDVFNGFDARVMQHELDHLDGVLFVDHLSDNEKRRIAMKLAKRGNGNVR